ncbi:hypothetical protein DFH11DRAFT_1558998 [Phellopilus nigrolimitatus]|nr:hypothetical protein DFH11DRAFT_1558998 [Phellopilus nigrolimitatus]
MFAKNITLFSGFLVFAAFANAHFQLQFPTPRGPFVEDSEPTFCDGYNNAVSNRSTFPLAQGFITLNSEHPDWSAQVLISIDQNPTNFSMFNTSSSGTQLPSACTGAACIAIDIANLGISNVKDGSNVTIQVQYDGGDGNLFQVYLFICLSV